LVKLILNFRRAGSEPNQQIFQNTPSPTFDTGPGHWHTCRPEVTERSDLTHERTWAERAKRDVEGKQWVASFQLSEGGGAACRETPVSRQRRAQAEAPFSAEFRDSCAAAFSLCPLMDKNGPFVTSGQEAVRS